MSGSSVSVFRDRVHGGRALAAHLSRFKDAHPLVLGLPRGGVPVAAEVARALDAPLDVLVVRKLGAPQHEEFGIGAIAPGGVQILDPQSVAAVGATQQQIQAVAARETAEMARRQEKYRGTKAPLDLAGRTVLLVDDGLATGVSARAAIQAARAMGAKRVIFAAPVAAPDSLRMLRTKAEVDEAIAVLQPARLRAVGEWYLDFTQTEDSEVEKLLADARRDRPAESSTAHAAQQTQPFHVQVAEGELRSRLESPPAPTGVVVFVHGSGSGMESPRNRMIAETIRAKGLATLLIDLLTASESQRDAITREYRFDIKRIGSRVIAAIDALGQHASTQHLPVFLIGSSTGAAAALVAAAARPDRVAAVVSRGGRPDLAGEALPNVHAPTILIVGGEDHDVLRLNEQARAKMTGALVRIAVVPGATHLFEERGTLEQAADITAQFIQQQQEQHQQQIKHHTPQHAHTSKMAAAAECKTSVAAAEHKE